MFKKLLFSITAFIGLATAGAVLAFFWLVVFYPGEDIKQKNIEKILSMESPVYYSDGREKIGVFFKEAHRQYIQYDAIPQDFINAIVAAEDNNFFEHFGFDIRGVLRAVKANIRAGRVVQGGSTLTQQAAKNLFKRKDRSLRSKLTELLYALRLEYHYPKNKILEFYTNQFYVSGNGHGLGVAAQYYFNKTAAELNTLECAFIAASVKRPNYYNPFIKENEEKAELAIRRARQRSTYVLGQMRKLGMISPEQYEEYRNQDIAFEQGKMFFPLNTLMDFVKAALAVPEVEEALSAHGIDNIATSGIRIYTTVEKSLQEQAFFGLRKELSRLSVRMKGYRHEELRQSYSELSRAADRDLRKGAFLFGTVLALDTAGAPVITVSLGKLTGRQNLTGTIDRAGLLPVVDSHVKWEKQRWTEPDEEDLDRFLGDFQVGDRIFVSVRKIDQENNRIFLDLEKYPKIQGGQLVLRDGTIRAMVGGMENHYFNRAVAAKRSMGSVIKPLVYTAAIQLGWNSIDPLYNDRNLFIYQKQAYFPRPDHHSPHQQVSMNWAGVYSENLATVWLLYHLCDRLTPAQFKELIGRLDLGRREFESHAGYRQRLRDSLGILVDEEQLRRAAFRQAVIKLEADLIFSGRHGEYQYLQKMQYGANFETFLEETENLEGAGYESEATRQQRVEKEKNIRQQLLRNNYLHHQGLLQELRLLQASFAEKGAPLPPTVLETFTGRFYYDAGRNVYIYAGEPGEAGSWQPLRREDIRKKLRPRSFARLRGDQEKFWNSLLLEGQVSLATMESLGSSFQAEFKNLSSLPPYSFEVLSRVPDFRVLAGLRYVTALGRALGIRSELEPVLSFPLGSNVISLLEAAKVYSALTTGHVTVSGSEDTVDELAIIERIENGEGETIYTPERKKARVVDPKTSLAVTAILQNIVKFGTGKYAHAHVRLHSRDPEVEQQLRQFDLPVPLMGKTGTANLFTNSAFAGVVPGPHGGENGFTVENGYTIAAYVGYDNNDPMVRNTTHITGATGALPVWSRTANAILLENEFGAGLDLVDLAFTVDPLTGRAGLRLIQPELQQKTIPVNTGTGLPAERGAAATGNATVLTFGTLMTDEALEPERYFQPFWSN